MTTKNRVGTQAIDTVATTSNNSSTNNPASDNRTPAPPATLTYSTSLEYTAGSYYAVVSLSWLPATAATDGTKMTPASTEIWQFRPTLGAGGTSVQQFDAPEQQTVTAVTAGKLPVLRTHLKALAGLGKLPKLTTHLIDESQVEVYVSAGSVASPNHAAVLHGYVPGQTWQFKIRAVGTNGKRSVFSNIVEVTMPTVVVAPPEPSKPLLYSDMGVVQVTWDGNSITGAPMPSDLDHLVVQRSVDALFANPYDVMSIFDSGTAIDGPLTVGTTYYYRFQAYNKIGQYGPPGGPPYSSIKVVGIDGAAIADGTIPNDAFNPDLLRKIEDAINATAGTSVPGNRVFPPSATAPTDPHPPDDLLRAGDLWPDSGNQMRMKRYDGVGNWVDLRDTIVQAAFSAAGGAIAAPFLLPNIVQTQVLLAGLIQAKDIIATGSINSAAGLFGTVDAGILNAGVISAQRIDAKSISADKLLIADLTNFIDDPGFTGGDVVVLTPPGPVPPAHTFPVLRWGTSHRLAPAWTTVSSGHIKAVADAPSLSNGTVVTSAGRVWSMLGNATSQSVTNTKTLSVVDTDQFYVEMWVRKISSVVSGTVSMVINLQTPTGPGTMTVLSQTFKAIDPVGTWVHLTGFVVPPPPTKKLPTYPPTPPDPAPTLSLLAGSYQLTTSLVVGSSVVAGEVQFASIVLRRKNNTNLIVDGSITASQIAASTITGYEIDANTIHAENIFAGTITATQIWAGTLTALMVRGDQFWAGGWDTTTGLSKYPGLLITKNSLDYSTSATNSVFHMDFQAGSMIMRSAQATSKSRYEIDLAGIRLYDSTNTKTVELKSDGTAFFQGAIDASTFAAMSMSTASGSMGGLTTGARVVLDKTGLFMYDSTNHAQFGLALAKVGTQAANSAFLTSDPAHEAIVGSMAARWTLKDSGFYFYDGTKVAVALLSTGSATFSGTITASNIDATNNIIGANIKTSTTSPLIEMVTVVGGTSNPSYEEFAMTNSLGNAIVMFRTAQTNPTADAWIILDTDPTNSGGPRFRLDTHSGLYWYRNPTTIGFQLSFVDGSVAMNGAVLTASTIQTGASNPRLVMSGTEFLMTDDQGNITVRFLPGSTSADAQIRLDTGIDSYPRFYFDSGVGMRWYRSSSDINFNFNFKAEGSTPAGSITMDGAIVTTGTITGSVITGGTVQTGTGAIAKVLMAANTGIRGYDTNGSTLVFYINMAGDAWFKGTVAAGSVASGATGSGNTWSAPILIGGSMSGGIGAGGATITGGVWKSSAGANRIEIAGNTISVISNNSLGGTIQDYAKTNDILIWGGSSTGTLWLGYNAAGGGGQFAIYNGGSNNSGAVYSSAIRDSHITAIASYDAVYCYSGSTSYMGVYTSSVRYKKAVRPLALNSGFMDIVPATWTDKPDRGSVAVRVGRPGLRKRHTGFTAENLHRAGMGDLVTYDEHLKPHGIQQPAILAHTVAYTQWLVRQVEELTARVAALEGAGV